MKQTVIILVAFMFLFQPSFTQVKAKDVTITFSEKSKEKRRVKVDEIIESDEKGFYVLKKKYKGLMGTSFNLILDHYSNDMRLMNSVPIELKAEGKKLDYEFIIPSNNKFYIYASYKNKRLKKNFLFVQSINKSTLKLNNDRKKIAEIDYSGKWWSSVGGFNYQVSRDGSKIMVYYSLPYRKKEKEKFGFHVFDKKMDLLWKKKITLPYFDYLYQVMDYNINNNGDVYFLGKVYNEKARESKKRKVNYKYEILRYFGKGGSLKKYPINVEGHFLNSMKIDINDDLDIICAGFYSLFAKSFLFHSELYVGSFYLKIDGESKRIVSKNFKEFGGDFLEQNLTKRQKKRVKKKKRKGKEVGLRQFVFQEIIIKDDGGAFLIGEIEYSITHTHTDSKGITTTTTTYYNLDIIVVSVSPSGEIEWEEKIAKRQISRSPHTFSYGTVIVKDKLNIIFNGNLKNLGYMGEGRVKSYSPGRKSVTYVVNLNKDGYQKRRILFTKKEQDVYAIPTQSVQVSRDELIMLCDRGKRFKFVKMKFD